MKKTLLYCLWIIAFSYYPTRNFSQTISVNGTYSTDTTVRPFSGFSKIYSLKVNGTVELHSDSSLVRMILVDESGNRRLLFETYPMISEWLSFSFADTCDETCFMNAAEPESLLVYVIDAIVTITDLKLDTNAITAVPELQDLAKGRHDSLKILNINKNIQAKNYYWRAGRTALQQRSYNEREILFGRNYNREGYEFFKGGVFQYSKTLPFKTVSSGFVGDFDWRFRHRANIPETPYYNSNGAGWITKPSVQPDNTCYAFGAIALGEAYANLYFNNNTGPNKTAHPDIKHQVDLDLSEMQLIHCCVQQPCSFASPLTAPWISGYMINHAIVNEECFPINCLNPGTCPHPMVDLTDSVQYTRQWLLTAVDSIVDSVRLKIIKYGPISCSIDEGQFPPDYHQVLLVGYSTGDLGDTIYSGSGQTDPPIVIDEDCPFLGSNLWWVKDSRFGDFRTLLSTDSIINNISPFFIEEVVRPMHPTPILCSDEDGDGYFWWGIHWQLVNGTPVRVNPSDCGCPPWVTVDQEDCDDSNPLSGPYLDSYECEDLSAGCTTLDSAIIINESYPEKTWLTDRRVNRNIIIEPNQVLEIKCDVFLSPGVKIVVKPQAILKISPRIIANKTYYSRITGGCGKMWNGVEVQGNPVESQEYLTQGGAARFQGMLIIDHGIIENALCGISTFNTGAIPFKTSSGQTVQYDGCPSGGIIQATDARFINNVTDVNFYPYRNGNEPNKSFFTHCTFSTEKELLEDKLPGYHVKFQGTNRMDLKACSFSNLRGDTATLAYEERGYGIYSFNSDIRLSEVNDTSRCTFTKLAYGIYAMNSGQGTAGIEVRKTIFSDCRRGIYISGFNPVESQVFMNNAFTNYHFCAKTGNDTYGLYLNNSTGFQVQNNSFVGDTALGKAQYGVVVNNSLARPNFIYKNNFSSLTYALTGLNINRGEYYFPDFILPKTVPYTIVETGLCFVCNTFFNNVNDICDTDEDSYSGGTGITYFQKNIADPGHPEREPAGNVFSSSHQNSSGVYDIYFDPSVGHIEYSFHRYSYLSGQRLDPEKVNIEDQLTRKSINQYFSDSTCPDVYYLAGSLNELQAKIGNADSKIDSIVSVLLESIDDGSTDTLRDEIENSNPFQTEELYQSLMSTSPYLSDTVIVTSVQKEDVLPNDLLTDIMVANPQSAKNEEILTAIDNRVNPMPDSLYSEIMEGKDSIGLKEIIENKLASWLQFRQLASNARLFIYNNDTLVSSPRDSLVNWLEQNYQLESKYDLVLFHLNEMHFDEAVSVLNDIPNTYDLSDEQLSCHQRFVDLSEIVEQLHHDSLGSFTPDSSQSAELQILADNDKDVPGSYARNILLFHHLINYNEPLTTGVAYKSSRLNKAKGKKAVVHEDVKIYPNPCRDYIIISANELISKDQVYLRIFDDNGRIIQPLSIQISHGIILVNTSDLIPGKYYLLLSFNGKKGTLYKIVHVK